PTHSKGWASFISHHPLPADVHLLDVQVRVDHHEIGPLTDLQTADLAVDSDDAGRGQARHPHRLGQRHSREPVHRPHPGVHAPPRVPCPSPREAGAWPPRAPPPPSSSPPRSPLPPAPTQSPPSGMSPARIESVTPASRSGPFSLYASRSRSAERCLPSAITSVVSSSKYSVASSMPPRIGNVCDWRSRARSDIAQNR